MNHNTHAREDSRLRVRNGRERERQIANALRDLGLQVQDATEYEDKQRKIDRWLVQDGKRVALQIKYRETGDDLLFEVYDRFDGWDNPTNKIGRDMQGDAKLYAVLKTDRETVVMVPTAQAKGIINDMISAAQNVGWTAEALYSKTLRYFVAGQKAELKWQRDPADGRGKLVAYIPAGVFQAQAQAQVYKVRLPKEWRFDK